MTQEQRATYWQNLIIDQNRSSQSVTDFCREHQIDRQRFYIWRQRFKSAAPGAGSFLELIPSSKNRESGIRLRMDQTVSIELDCNFDPATLRRVISLLR